MTVTERRSFTLHIEVVFRLAERSDLPRLEWGGEYAHFRRVFQTTFQDQQAGTRLMLLAVVNNFPIGQVFILLEGYNDFWTHMRRNGYLYSLRVMDAFRHMGIGTALLEEAESILRGKRYDTASIAAAKTNPSARRLYERQGFRVVAEDAGRWHYTDHEGHVQHVVEPCWIMEKSLS